MPEAMSHQRFLTILSVLWASSAAFKLLDVGAPRAGTQTMYDAMRILGFNPLHTGVSREMRPPLCDYLFGNGRLEDALATLGAFDGAMDEPVMLMYEEVMAAFPETKFLLTIRDAESWFSNYLHVGQMMYFSADVAGWVADTNSTDYKCSGMRAWGCNFRDPSAEEKETCLQNYARHNERVQEVIPPERLLVYNWSDGWAPLAHFLGTAIPEEEFPHEDSLVLGVTIQAAASAAVAYGLG